MILEIADFRIPPGQNAAFEAAIAHGLKTVVSRSPGFINATVQASIESSDRYVLLIQWQKLEDHTVTFRQGPLFAEWRAIVGPYFAVPPFVEHFNQVVEL